MSTYAEQIGGFTAKLKYQDIPVKLVTKIKLHLLDAMGVSFACSTLPYAKILIEIIRESGEKAESTAVGFGDKLPVRAAAFINGSMAHGYNFDDTHIQAIVHPTGIIMPTVFSVGEKEKIDGKTAMVAIAAGLEILNRMGLAAPGMVLRGIEPNAACGVFGAAVAAGRVYAMKPEQIATAIGICGSLASGSMEWEADGSWSWCIHAGWAAQGGILAAQMARKGFSGPHTILEGKAGFYNAFAVEGNYDLGILSEGLGSRWETANLSFKPYPACQGAQAYIDCALAIREEHNIDAEQIEEIHCKVNTLIGIRLCEPPEVKVTPPNADSAQTSIPYTVSVALIEGKVGVPEVSEDRIGDPQILNLARKVKVTLDEAYNEGTAVRGWVGVRMKDGKWYEKEVNHCKGTPENPLTEKEVTDKFISNATMVMPEAKAMKIVESMKRLDELSDISELVTLCKK